MKRRLCQIFLCSVTACLAHSMGIALAQEITLEPTGLIGKCHSVDTIWVTFDDQLTGIEGVSLRMNYDQNIAVFVDSLDTVLVAPALEGNVFMEYRVYPPDSLVVDLGVLIGAFDGPGPILGVVLALGDQLGATPFLLDRSILRNATNEDVPHTIGIGGFETDCCCQHHGNMDGLGQIDASDLAMLIDYVFFGALPPPVDLGCPHIDRSDVSCDGQPNAVDIAVLVDYVYFGGTLCDPCDCTVYPSDCPF